MDPISLAVMAGSKLLQNISDREQQARMGIANAETMRYSPWTGLASAANQGFQQNMAFNPNTNLAQGATDVFATAKAQEKADELAKKEEERQKKEDLYRERELKIRENMAGKPIYQQLMSGMFQQPQPQSNWHAPMALPWSSIAGR